MNALLIRLIGIGLILMPEGAITSALGFSLIAASFSGRHNRYPELMGNCRCYCCSGYKVFLERR